MSELPPRPSVEHLRKQAKDLLRAFRAGDPGAMAKLLPPGGPPVEPKLADARLAVARDYGFASWAKLIGHVESVVAGGPSPLERAKAAFHNQDADLLRQLLRLHPELKPMVNEPLFSFDAPAVIHARTREMLDVLLEAGADINARSRWWAGGFGVLDNAAPDLAAYAIARGARVDANAAAHLGMLDKLRELVDADPSRVHARGGDGQTPLHFARSRAVVDMLLEAGADVDARDVDHRATPAQWMIGDGVGSARYELARYLVERGATADIFLAAALGLTDRVRAMLERDPSLLQLRTGQGEYGQRPPSAQHIYQWTIGAHRSPLHAAAKFGQRETLAAMERFASPVERLLIACYRADGEAARAVIAAHPGIMQRLDLVERGALTDEAWASNAPAVELMLELGFDPAAMSVTNHTGGTALHCAAWQGSLACVEAIVRRPAGIALLEVKDPMHHGTPLVWCAHGSVHRGNPHGEYAAIARALIAAGARVEPMYLEWDGTDEVLAVLEKAVNAMDAAREPAQPSLEPSAHASDDTLSTLIPYLGCVIRRTEEGLELTGSGDPALKAAAITPERFRPPFTLRVTAKTDSTNLRLYWHAGEIIFNWEVSERELRVHDPATGRQSGYADRGFIAPGHFHEIVWSIDAGAMSVTVDGEQRYAGEGRYGHIEAPIGVGPCFGSTVVVRELDVSTR